MGQIAYFRRLFWDDDELVAIWADEPGVILELNVAAMGRGHADDFKKWLIDHAQNDGLVDV